MPTAWFGLGDRDLATHLVRRQMLDAGYPLSQVTAALCERWQPGATLLPMSDDRVETHVRVERRRRRAGHPLPGVVDQAPGGPARARRSSRSAPRPAAPAPGVLEAIAAADVVLLPPSNPVVSIGTVLQVPGIREALRDEEASSGCRRSSAARRCAGMADACLAAIGVETSAEAVGRHYGARSRAGCSTAGSSTPPTPARRCPGVEVRAVPLLMTDLDATAAMARAALDLAGA